jgi:hypothetical protein
VPQPQITGTPPILQFGGLALPNGQGSLSNINLNDAASWYWMGWWGSASADADYPLHAVGRSVWRSKGVFLGQDAGSRKISFPMRYREATAPLGTALAKLTQAGLQNLTFDNLTAVPVKFSGFRNRQLWIKYPTYFWQGDLEFLAPSPYFADLSATTLASTPIVYAPTAAPVGAPAAGGALTAGTYTLGFTYVTASGETSLSPVSSGIVLSGGNLQIAVSAVTPLPSFATAVKWYFAAGFANPTLGFTVQNSGGAFTLNTAGNGVAPPATTPATAFSIAYAGSVFAEPVFTLSIPSSNAAVIAGVTLTNTLNGEILTAPLGGLVALTAYTITMDSGAMSVVDGAGKAYDNTGNAFPNLYGPVGQSNAFTVAVTVASGLPSGLTLAGSWNPRWEM